MPAQLIVLAVFGSIFAMIMGAYWVFVLRQEEEEIRAVKRRLRTQPVTRLAPVVKAETRLSNVGVVDTLLHSSERIAVPLQRLIAHAGMEITPGVLLLSSVLAALVALLLVNVLARSIFAALIAAVICGAAPILYVRRAAAKRLMKFEDQFPEAIDLIARSLRAGHALPTAMQLAAEEMPDPVGTEFQLLFDRQNFGMSLTDALREFAARVPLLDARFFVTAVLTQRETGGNLSAVLDNLSSVIRERFTVKRQVRVLSAHGRITGWVLGLLPPVLAVILFALAPAHMRLLFDDPIGVRMVIAGLVLQVVGVLAIRRIVDVEY